MDISQLRIALFSGNYNMTTDGANKALNRLVEYLLRMGAEVRVYSPTIAEPAFEPQGELVSLPSFAIPGRAEYRIPIGLSRDVRQDLERFDPDILHISSPDFSARAATRWAKAREIPVLASVHTRFETYPRYYGFGFLEGILENWIRNLYQRCDALVTPSPSMIETLREQEMNDDIALWSRGVDHGIFNPERRSMEWRRKLGISDDAVVIGFLGRLVMEKGLDIFADTIRLMRQRGVEHDVIVIGEGPAEDWFRKQLPDAKFVGFQNGEDLGRAVASMDVLFNPSVTETFGNVTLEAMACGVPVVAAKATGSASLVEDGVNGALVEPGDAEAFGDALQTYCFDVELRLAHGKKGAARAQVFDWDTINQAVADTYVRLVRAARSKA